MVNFFKRFKLADQQVQTPYGVAQQQPKVIDIVHTKPVGSTGTISYAGYPNEEYLNELKREDRAKLFDKMRRSDTQIKMLMGAVKNPIRSAVWEVEPADDSLDAQMDADLIKQILFKDIKFKKKILNSALTMLDFGHAVIEKTYKTAYHPAFGFYHTIAGLDLISAKTINRWNLRPDGDLDSVTQLANGDLFRYVDIPKEYLLLFNLDQEGSLFEGISWLRPCYGSWLRKNVYLKLNAIGIEKFAVKTPIAKIPAGSQSDQQYANLIESLVMYTSGQANYLTIPAGWEINFDAAGTYDPSKVEASIDGEDKRMAKAFCANFLELGMNGSGSFAMSEDLSDFFLDGIEFLASEIADVINDGLIPELIKLNRGTRQAYPRLKHSGISDKAGKELSEALSNLVTSKIVTPDDLLEESMRKRYHLPKKSDIGVRDASPPQPQMPGMAPAPIANKISSLSERIRARIRR